MWTKWTWESLDRLDRISLHLRVPHIWPAALLEVGGDRGEGRGNSGVFSVQEVRSYTIQNHAEAVLWLLAFFSVQIFSRLNK